MFLLSEIFFLINLKDLNTKINKKEDPNKPVDNRLPINMLWGYVFTKDDSKLFPKKGFCKN